MLLPERHLLLEGSLRLAHRQERHAAGLGLRRGVASFRPREEAERLLSLPAGRRGAPSPSRRGRGRPGAPGSASPARPGGGARRGGSSPAAAGPPARRGHPAGAKPVRRNESPAVVKPGVTSVRAAQRYGSSFSVPQARGRAPAARARRERAGEVVELFGRAAGGGTGEAAAERLGEGVERPEEARHHEAVGAGEARLVPQLDLRQQVEGEVAPPLPLEPARQERHGAGVELLLQVEAGRLHARGGHGVGAPREGGEGAGGGRLRRVGDEGLEDGEGAVRVAVVPLQVGEDEEARLFRERLRAAERLVGLLQPSGLLECADPLLDERGVPGEERGTLGPESRGRRRAPGPRRPSRSAPWQRPRAGARARRRRGRPSRPRTRRASAGSGRPSGRPRPRPGRRSLRPSGRAPARPRRGPPARASPRRGGGRRRGRSRHRPRSASRARRRAPGSASGSGRSARRRPSSSRAPSSGRRRPSGRSRERATPRRRAPRDASPPPGPASRRGGGRTAFGREALRTSADPHRRAGEPVVPRAVDRLEEDRDGARDPLRKEELGDVRLRRVVPTERARGDLRRRGR